eukprot:CAMPEP_0182434404 /NCGR_PEP_ID=MMETSP1167-20130531/69617_1 /TAXON_ID=2988 /ORGANISM="Mallomonas Sp, Strain CCMP3275" /LENGTH=626 /DNA_ID=CAMNT_0024624247 /DNA_START=143 /DNA_END=2024 /DNA_ORIENTATION=+
MLEEPETTKPFFESAAKEGLKTLLTASTAQEASDVSIPDFQIVLRSSQNSLSLRQLTSEHVNKLIKVPGIIISCSKTRSKATIIVVRCTKCQNVKKLIPKGPMAGVNIPNKCDAVSTMVNDCPGQYIVMADQCEYIDQQTLKLQESPEAVPTGEMPRNIQLAVDRYLVDRVVPGTRVAVLAISSLFNSGVRQKVATSSPIKTPYLRVLGIHIQSEGGGRTTSHFTPQEEDEFQRMARDEHIYEKLARSIAPQISGEYTVDLKRAIACLLMSGSRKTLPDNTRLRGDINVLLMGDPSTAKSQFLKFVEKVAPIAVYTSGKGSSAAGLTASVVKDSKGEFYLEGGAMVLADGGVICIDEFDKMRETDRVAIHEAMEQQTISVAKAGITTVLNSRVSVLAAANPIYGRYDDTKSIGDNIDLMTTILSRFDMIFVVRDVRDRERDIGIAQHVLDVHMSSNTADSVPEGEIGSAVLRKYVAYCRERCAPRLNEEAARLLSSQYVAIRQQVSRGLKDRAGETQVIPITIRQLEALVRISESLAKMRLSSEATISDVQEALRLFRVSTLAAGEANPNLLGGGEEMIKEIRRAEEFLKRRMGLRMTEVPRWYKKKHKYKVIIMKRLEKLLLEWS